MEYSLTNAGVDAVAELFSARVARVAVGTGTRAVSGGDTALDAKLYEESVETAAATVETVNKAGTVRVSIVVTGGLGVPADADIYELGVLDSDGQLLYRQVSDNPRTVDAGQTLKIESDIRFSQTTV